MKIIEHGLIITTPEKFNLLLRKWRAYFSSINQISLILIDEIHYLGDDNWGANIEAMITRILFLS